SAKTSVTGVVRNDRLQALKYSLYYKSGKKKARFYEVSYRNGNIISATTTPAPKRPEIGSSTERMSRGVTSIQFFGR
ncbi:hypothetical protein ACC745_39605, partial [Rhizobium ruizarguesonis]